MTTASLVLPPDLSQEEAAASHIHLRKPTQDDIFGRSILSDVQTLKRRPALSPLSFLIEAFEQSKQREY